MSSPDSPVSRTAGMSPEHRAALIAHLAEQLAAVPARPAPVRPASPPDSFAEGTATEMPPTGRRSSPPRSSASAGRTGVVGAGDGEGSGRGRRADGGHPEDAPGDPETVAKQICLRQLTAAAKPRAALADVLRRRGIPDDVAHSVLDRFTEVGLIDDEAYAAAYVSTKQRDRSLGAGALRVELRRKGLDDEIVAAAVADIDDVDERARAADLVARRIDAAMQRGSVAARRRLVGLLARRGYPSGLAYAVVSDAVAAYLAEFPDPDDPALTENGPEIDEAASGSDADEPSAAPDDGDVPRGRSRWPRRTLRTS